MAKDGKAEAVCRRCRRPLAFVRQGEIMAFFEPCPRHPHNSRYDSESGDLTTVPHMTARRDRVLVGVMLSDLRSTNDPYAA